MKGVHVALEGGAQQLEDGVPGFEGRMDGKGASSSVFNFLMRVKPTWKVNQINTRNGL